MTLTLPDYKVEHVQHVLNLFYTGKTIFEPSNCRCVSNLLDFLNVNIETCYQTASAEDMRKQKYLRHYIEMPSSDSEGMDEDDDEQLVTKDPDLLSKVTNWQQNTSVTSDVEHSGALSDTQDKLALETELDNRRSSDHESVDGSRDKSPSEADELEQHGIIAEEPIRRGRGRGRRGRGRGRFQMTMALVKTAKKKTSKLMLLFFLFSQYNDLCVVITFNFFSYSVIDEFVRLMII